MVIQQFFIPGIAHSSYLVGAAGACAVIDPARDVDRYLDAAADLGFTITHILETHLHADFVSGHMDLAEKTGAQIYAPKSGSCAFPHEPVADGTEFSVGDIRFDVLDTPGHTPDGVTYVAIDLSRGDEPVAVFPGDTLFVGDVGRPDLFPGQARDLAGRLHESLHEKILALPDHCMVFPAHGAGSLCGRAMGSMRSTTIGYERRYNAALRIADRDEFVRSLTTGMPPAPDHFSRCSEINRRGPPLVRTLPAIRPMKPAEFREKAGKGDAIVLSVNDYAAFGGQHVPGSYHIDLAGNFSTFAGWVLPPEKEVLIVAGSQAEAEEAVVMLRRVGLDHAVGYLDGGVHAWVTAGYPTAHVPQLSPAETHAMITGGKAVLLDVRAPDEYEEDHVESAVNIMVTDLRERSATLDPARPLVVMCRTGHRSSLGCSILRQKGFVEVYNASGGITGYRAAGYT